MRTVGVTMVKDEADVAEAVVRWTVAQGVAHVLVADNDSRDGTAEILRALARSLPLTVVHDPEPRFHQAEALDRLARLARRDHGADWILPFDADELWTLPPDFPGTSADAVAAPFWNYVGTALDDPADPNPFTRLRWREPEAQFQKVAFRWRRGMRLEPGSHWVARRKPLRRKARRVRPDRPAGLELRHFPVRSLEQMRRKYVQGKRAVDAAGDAFHPLVATHWRALGRLAESDPEALRAEFERCFWSQVPSGRYVLDPVRWPSPSGAEPVVARG